MHDTVYVAGNKAGDGEAATAPEPANAPATVAVEGGRFKMGGGVGGNDDEYPVHWVRVDGFRMAKYETTVGEFRRFIKATGYITDAEKDGYSFVYTGAIVEKKNGVTWACNIAGNIRPAGEDNHPVIHVSWNDAKAYCQWLSRQTTGNYDLPTEAQWEFAAKGGGSQSGFTYSGGDNLASVGWFEDNSDSKTHVVGQKSPNSLGIYDMSGNVAEWCADWYGFDYYKNSPEKNPTGAATGAGRMCRGGSWYGDAAYCRSADRGTDAPAYRNSDIGFRVVSAP